MFAEKTGKATEGEEVLGDRGEEKKIGKKVKSQQTRGREREGLLEKGKTRKEIRNRQEGTDLLDNRGEWERVGEKKRGEVGQNGRSWRTGGLWKECPNVPPKTP